MVCHRIVVVFLAILSPTSGIVEVWNGNEVMEYCEPGPKLQYSRFYVTGITDALSGSGFFCLPRGVHVGQVGDIRSTAAAVAANTVSGVGTCWCCKTAELRGC